MYVLCLHFLGWYFRNVCVCMSLCFRSLIIKYTCTMFILTILISFLFSIVLSFVLSLYLVFFFCKFCSNELQTLSELKPNHTRPSYRMWGKASTYMHVSILHSRSEKYTKLRDDGINWLHFRWFCLFVFVYHSIQSNPHISSPIRFVRRSFRLCSGNDNTCSYSIGQFNIQVRKTEGSEKK